MRLHWGRIIVGAIALELTLIVLLVPLLNRVQMAILAPLAAVACAVVGFAWGWWVARKIQSGYVFHGAAAGVLATAIYLGLCFMNPDGGIRAVVAMYGILYFVLGNLLRILGTTAGAYVFQTRRKA